ncbi:MAG: hypothetical protein QW244_02460 [Candidatus Pacearchaeota archaeon]
METKRGYFIAGIVLSLFALFFLLVNAIIGLAYGSELITGATIAGIDAGTLKNSLTFLSLFWIFLSVILLGALIRVYRKLKGWFYLLVIAMLALFSFRLESFILLLISSILFWKAGR